MIIFFFSLGLLAGLFRQAVKEYRKYQAALNKGRSEMRENDLRLGYPGKTVVWTGTHYEVL